MIYYLTYNEPYNGIFNSQVVDVVKHIRNEHNVRIRLISFIPISYDVSLFSKTKSKIKAIEETAIIIPTLPIQYGWRFNWVFLAIVLLFMTKGSVFSREIIASYLALKCKRIGLIRKVCHDGRGANVAQLEEYCVYSKSFKNDITEIEPFVVNNSDFRLAVSNNLVRYWEEKFGYRSHAHVVIPCTISSDFFVSKEDMNVNDRIRIRKKYNLNDEDIVLVFSGSSFGWQSFELIKQFCEIHLNAIKTCKVVFLSKLDDSVKYLMDKFPGRVYCEWLDLNHVIPFLAICDYGLLLREANYTNNVASPTKFAEYLAAGLPVLVSDNLEFSRFVHQLNCGMLINNDKIELLDLKQTDDILRGDMKKIAREYFLKTSIPNKQLYDKLIKNII